MGFEITEGPFPYKSKASPVPLSELEEALLVGVGVGVTGTRKELAEHTLDGLAFWVHMAERGHVGWVFVVGQKPVPFVRGAKQDGRAL